jgi:excisionase family DNA binding protein
MVHSSECCASWQSAPFACLVAKGKHSHEGTAVKIFYTVAEAKNALGIGTTRLYELLAAGRLRARKLGNTTLIEAESMQELVKSLPLGKFTTHAKQMAARSQNLRPHHGDDSPGAM